MRTIAAVALGLASLFVSAPSLAQGQPPPPPNETQPCSADTDCPTGSTCALPDCPPCSSADPTCDPNACGTGICVLGPPPGAGCNTNADCPEGQFCELTDCGPSCDPDDPTCEPTDCGGGGFCVDRGSPPAPACASDADCDEGNVCITETYESCTSDGCACPIDGDGNPDNDPPCDCPPPSEPTCTTETVSFCGPRWLDECGADADCGPGFTCEQVEDCTCSIDSAGNESCDCAADAPTRSFCQLIRVECTDDADCDNDFVCAEDTAEGNCVVDDTGEPTCAPLTKVCVPPDYDEVFPVDGEENGPRDDEDPVSPVDDGTSDDDADAPGSRVDDADDDDDDNAGDSFVLNCAQGGSVGALPLAALGLLLLRRRRR